jgi:hypothetical protein
MLSFVSSHTRWSQRTVTGWLSTDLNPKNKILNFLTWSVWPWFVIVLNFQNSSYYLCEGSHQLNGNQNSKVNLTSTIFLKSNRTGKVCEEPMRFHCRFLVLVFLIEFFENVLTNPMLILNIKELLLMMMFYC